MRTVGLTSVSRETSAPKVTPVVEKPAEEKKPTPKKSVKK